jgi:hypothetical protein
MAAWAEIAASTFTRTEIGHTILWMGHGQIQHFWVRNENDECDQCELAKLKIACDRRA